MNSDQQLISNLKQLSLKPVDSALVIDTKLYDYSQQCVNGVMDNDKCLCMSGWFDIPTSPYMCAWNTSIEVLGGINSTYYE